MRLRHLAIYLRAIPFRPRLIPEKLLILLDHFAICFPFWETTSLLPFVPTKFPAPECYLRYKSCLYLLFFSHHRVSDPRKSMFLPWNRVGVSVQGITSTDSRCSAILVAHRDYLPLIRSLKSAVYHEGIGNRGQCLAWKRWNCFSLLRFGMANSMMRFLHSKGSHFRGRSWYYKGILHLAALVVSWRAKVSSLDSEGSGK